MKTERDSAILCKCMLMRNLPMPDFRVQWTEGTSVRYQLHDGTMRVDVPRSEPNPSSLSRLFNPEEGDEREGGSGGLKHEVDTPRDLRDLSGYTDCADETILYSEGEEAEDAEACGPPLRWQGSIGAADVVIPPRVAGYVRVAQVALALMLEQSKCDLRTSCASLRNASSGPKVHVL